MLALVTPSCSVKTAWGAMSDLCCLHLCCPTDTQHSGKKLTRRFSSLRNSSRHFQNSTKINPPSQFKLFSYLLPASLSNSQPLCFIRSTAELMPYFPLQLLLMLLSLWATKNLQPHHTKKTLSLTREVLLVCSKNSQGSREQHQEPKLTNLTAHTTCRQHALQGMKNVKCLQRKTLVAEGSPCHRPNYQD